MNSLLRRTVTLFTGIIAVAVFTVAFVSVDVQASHSWGGYHWARTANPFTVQLGSNLTSDWRPYLTTTSNDWSLSSVLDTQVVAGSTLPRQCKASSGKIEVCNAKYGRNGWLGLAQIWISGDHIVQGVVKMNDTYMQRAPYNTTAEKNHVMCQEVGHTLGLGHQDETGAALGTCMDYSMDTGSQHPNQHDYQQLEAIYAHLDGFNTVGTTTTSAPREAVDEPSQWGQRVHRSENGRAEVYVRGFKDGQKVVTFVNRVH